MSTAGDLGHGEIGQMIRFVTEDGATIEDILINVAHFDDITYVKVRSVVPDGVLRQQMIQFASAFRLKPTDYVGVAPKKEDQNA